jgi:hypothetical protein
VNTGQLGLEDLAVAPTHLERWEPWVRAALFDFEALSRLHLRRHTANGQTNFSLYHLEAPFGGAATHTEIITLIRPGDANVQFWLEQLVLVDGHADLREDRGSEILAQLGPPVAFWSSILNLHPDRTRWTLELLDMGLRLANFVEMRFKNALAVRRPIDYSPQVQPMILTPGHGSLPSGHATEAFMVAYVLWQLLRAKDAAKDVQWCEQLMRQAARIAINRTIAGVHFPVDSAAGELLGLTLGEYFVHRCLGGATGYDAARFNGQNYLGNSDFDWRLLYDTTANPAPARAYPGVANPFAERTAAQQQVGASLYLQWLWGKAANEWF